jgi:secretion/DNA translocation related CpaE-like protein
MTVEANQIIGVISGCGGAGASVLAASVAACAAELTSGQAVLVDCDRLGGGIDVLLGCEQHPGPRWPQVRLGGGELSADSLLGALPRWGSVSFLAADSPDDIDPDAVLQVVSSAVQAAPVILDVPRWPSPLRAAILQRCHRVVLVVPAEVRAVTASAVVAAALDPDTSSVAVRGASRTLSAPRVAEVLGLPAIGVIPFEAKLARSGGLDVDRIPRGLRRVSMAILESIEADPIAAQSVDRPAA